MDGCIPVVVGILLAADIDQEAVHNLVVDIPTSSSPLLLFFVIRREYKSVREALVGLNRVQDGLCDNGRERDLK